MRSRAIALIALWSLMASPLLACLPNSSMSPAEMECCKKMAGNCEKGGGNHKCCDTTMNGPSPSAILTHSTPTVDAGLAIVAPSESFVISETPSMQHLGQCFAPVSPSPPGFSLSLRI